MANRAWTAALTAMLLVALPRLAHATIIDGESFEEMARNTPLIVRGVVGPQQARWNDGHTRIDTLTEIQVSEVLKGDAPSILLVRQPGGVVGDIGAHVAGAARFTPGEEVVLFLERPADDPGLFIVRGLGAGKVLLERTALGEVRARRDLRGIAFYVREPNREPVIRDLNNVEDLGTAEAFLTRLKAAIAAAKGGAR